MAPDRWIALDDTNKAINYTGSWFLDTSSKDTVGNFGSPYLHTLHGISTNGTVFVEFDGTAVIVLGSNVNQNTTNPDPNFECFIDDVSIGRADPFQFAENNWVFCNKKGLPDGLHKLRIDVTVKSLDHTFWLDQIQYNPSPTVPLDNQVLVLGNTDPAISYDASWEEWPARLGNITSKTNSVARVNFIGTSVTWMGFTPTERPHTKAIATWAIDGGDPTAFTLQGLSNSTNASTEFSQTYFTTPEVKQGPHTLTVTFLGNGQTTPLSIGSLLIKNGSILDSDTQTSSTQSPPSSTQTQIPNAQPSKPPPLGAIIGGVLGALAFLLLILSGSYLYRRRQRREKVDRARYCLTPPASPSHDRHPPDFNDTMPQTHQRRSYSASEPSIATSVPEQQQSGAHWRKQREARAHGGQPQNHGGPLPVYTEVGNGVILSWQSNVIPFEDGGSEGQSTGAVAQLDEEPIRSALPRYTRE